MTGTTQEDFQQAILFLILCICYGLFSMYLLWIIFFLNVRPAVTENNYSRNVEFISSNIRQIALQRLEESMNREGMEIDRTNRPRFSTIIL